MTRYLNRLFLTLLILCGLVARAPAQEQPIVNTTEILDTAILFAIGAREAEQVLRGSFGWPTFQEGFVEDVYFRFDPDGYARFSTSPRLDEDVFEVICAESSTACIAQKLGLRIGLTDSNAIMLQIDGIAPTDSLYLSDRTNELPLPNTILEPLDSRLEALLAAGGNLIVKREVETIQVISLTGFSAVTTYLRWVAQGQNPRAFPHGWPVPAQFNTPTDNGLTQPDSWTSVNSTAPNAQSAFAAQANLESSGWQGVPTGNGAFQNSVGQHLQPPPTTFQRNMGFPASQRPMNTSQMQLGGPAQNVDQNLMSEISALRQQVQQLRSSGAPQQQNHQTHIPFQTAAQAGAQAPLMNNAMQPYPANNGQQMQPLQPNLLQPAQNMNLGPLLTQTADNKDARISALEAQVAQLQQDLSQMRAYVMANSQAGGAAPSNMPAVQTPTAVSNPQPDSDALLEQLLLRRLNSELPANPLPNQVNTPPANNPMAPSIPGQQYNAQNNQVALPLQPISPANAATLPAAPAADSQGFINLAEYLNNVLRSDQTQ